MPSASLPLCFGDEIKLHCRSVYKRDPQTKEFPKDYLGGYIGVYDKPNRASRVVVPPLGENIKGTFTESVFRVEDPRESFPGCSHGKPVRYADWVVLIDQSGYVWNNKSGGYFEGYLGPRPRGSPGEMYLSFAKMGAEHQIVQYLHDDIYIDVEDSHRYRTHTYNRRLGNYKTPASKIEGGYLVSDGTGEPLAVAIHRAEADDIASDALGQPAASVLCVGVLREGSPREDVMVVGPKYGSGITLFGVNKSDEVRIHLSNGGVAAIAGADFEVGHDREVVVTGEQMQVMPSSTGIGSAEAKGAEASNILGRLKISWKECGWHAGCGEAGGDGALTSRAAAALPLLKAFIGFSVVYLAAEFILEELGLRPLWSSLAVAWIAGLLTPPAARSSLASAGSVTTSGADEEDRKTYVMTVALGEDPRHHSSLERQFSMTKELASQASLKGTWELPGVDEDGKPRHPAYLRFLNGEQGDREVALKRWKITTDWRRERNVDNILSQPHRHFDVIKANYPHFFFRRGKKGHPVYIEQPGGVSMANLKAAGVKLKDLLWHYLYITEYLWTRLEPSETAMTITILDLKAFRFPFTILTRERQTSCRFDFAGEVIDFVKKASAFVQEHYPERSYQIFVVNTPRWFSSLWNMVKPMVNERTRTKMHIHRSGYERVTTKELLEHIDAADLPVCYGGTCEMELGDSAEEKLLRNLVYKVLKEEATESTGADGRPVPGTPDSLVVDTTIDEYDVWDQFEAKQGIPSTTGKKQKDLRSAGPTIGAGDDDDDDDDEVTTIASSELDSVMSSNATLNSQDSTKELE